MIYKGMIKIKRYLSLLLGVLFLLSSCSWKTPIFDNTDEDGLIINEMESVIRIFAEDAKTLNPCANIPESLADAMEIIYEPLFDFDDALNPIPVLAKSCEAYGESQYKIKVKNGIKWHDGTQFTADDVVYTINLLKTEKNNYSKEIAKVTEAVLVSPDELLVSVSEPVVNFTGLLSFPVVKKDTQLYAKVAPTGTGPYKFSKKKGNVYTFVKNDEWHMGDASDKTITLTLMKDTESAVYAFDANEADLISSRITDLKDNVPRGNVFEHGYLSNRLVFLGMNTSEGVLSDAEVRVALSYLIDKNSIIKKHLYSKGRAVDVPVYPKAWFYDAKEDSIEVNIDSSYLEKILNKFDWHKKNGLYTKDYDDYDAELTLSILINKENAERKAIAEDIADIFKKAGIIVKIKTAPYEEYTQRIKNGEYSMFIGEIEMDKNMDPSNLVRSGENYFSYSSEEMDAQLARMTQPDADLTKLYSDFSTVFLKDMPFVPLFFREESLITNSHMSGIGTPNYYRIYRNVENWYVSRKTEVKK